MSLFMKIVTRILAIICTVSILITLCMSVSASAQTTLTVDSVNAEAGADVEVAIDLSGNEVGVLGMMISVSYDENLTLKNAVAGTALSSLDFTLGKDITANPINIAWDGVEADSTNGTIAVLTFTVPENAEGTYNINVSYEVGNIYDNDYEDIDVSVVNGKINVSRAITEEAMSIKNYVKGDTTTFTLDLVSPDSISGKVLVATYCDNKSRMNDVDIYDAISSRDISVSTKGMDTLKIFWWDGLSTLRPITEAIEIDLTK